jgi:AraC family transcriptional regulator, regulatory protein of adaptative response / DNA-3-methyladenine glycosylase II
VCGRLAPVIGDFDLCYRAISAKDPRFDGWFFTAVTSTGVYCRPSCPALTPKPEHVRFYASAAACQQAGFRACERCRPDATPGSSAWNSRGDVVARAMRLIGDGLIDREGVPGLAAALGYSVRQLQRLLVAEVGAGPLALARAQRAQTARTLIESSSLSMAEVALAAGFASIRQFNETVRMVFALTPTDLRRRSGVIAPAGGGWLRIKLAFRRPLLPENLFGHLAATAIPGVEEIRDATYRRTLRLPHGAGIAELSPRSDHISCRLQLADVRDLTAAVTRCRWLLDLDADPEAIDGQLSQDRGLRPLIAQARGRRVPRSVDGVEMAIRAVLGQQISTVAARTHAARLVIEHGEPVADPEGSLSHAFPAPEALAETDLAMPAGRTRTLLALLEAVRSGALDLSPAGDRDEALARLAALPGVGPWTRDMIAMRVFGDPDAFPDGDLGVRRGAARLGLPAARSVLLARAERWRPWRAYAVQHLWAATAHPINQWPPTPARVVQTTPPAAPPRPARRAA